MAKLFIIYFAMFTDLTSTKKNTVVIVVIVVVVVDTAQDSDVRQHDQRVTKNYHTITTSHPQPDKRLLNNL